MSTSSKSFKSGTHRSATPEETFEKIKPFLPVFGITRISNITGLDRIGIPVATAIRPNSKALASSQGKGQTLISAKVSALMESIEGFHAENIFKPLISMSYEDILPREFIADITGLPRYHSVSFSSQQRIYWIKGYDYISKEEIWVPYDTISTDCASEPKHPAFITDSNGLSSGNTHLESIIHGLAEIIERDALAQYFLNPRIYERRKVIPDTIQDAQNKKLIDMLYKANIEFGIWNITSEIGIPTYICKMIDSSSNEVTCTRPTYGSGTHLNKEVALFRAITEAAQSRATFIAGARDDQPLENYSFSYQTETLDKWRIEISAPNHMNDQDQESYDNDYFEDDLHFLLTQLRSIGVEQVI